METVQVNIKPDTPELKMLCDAQARANGNEILELALIHFVSRLAVEALADQRFRESLLEGAEERKARAKRERIEQLRAELAKLEAE
ncbi:hypothetical protein ACIP1G_11085 [Pseudomonas sp. NPDC089392]|uniref:hypothetical protein n=1 Tax=Pseudomonas sp. NPDC089392 TaxID=3364459 RepID=UPI00381B2746